MKLEIENSENGCNDLYFRIDNQYIRNGVGIKCFDEEDVLIYLGNKKYNQFKNGTWEFRINRDTYNKIFFNI